MKTQPKDDKYLNFMRMYNMQSEKLKRENQQLKEQIASLSNEDYSERANANVVAQNEELKDMLRQNAEEFKDLL